MEGTDSSSSDDPELRFFLSVQGLDGTSIGWVPLIGGQLGEMREPLTARQFVERQAVGLPRAVPPPAPRLRFSHFLHQAVNGMIPGVSMALAIVYLAQRFSRLGATVTFTPMNVRLFDGKLFVQEQEGKMLDIKLYQQQDYSRAQQQGRQQGTEATTEKKKGFMHSVLQMVGME